MQAAANRRYNPVTNHTPASVPTIPSVVERWLSVILRPVDNQATKPPRLRTAGGNTHPTEEMSEAFGRMLPGALQSKAQEAAKSRDNKTPAGRLVNEFRSKLARDLRSCGKDFEDLDPTVYHSYIFSELTRLKRRQQQEKAPVMDIRSTIAQMRMTADSIAAFQASKERTEAIAKKSQDNSLGEQLARMRKQALEDEAGFEDEEEGGSPVYGDQEED